MDVQTRVGMPMDEFIREYDKAPFELVRGRIIPACRVWLFTQSFK